MKSNEFRLNNILGPVESIYANDTYQFDDYSKYVATVFDSDKKAKSKEEQFPEDCKKAYEMGLRFTEQISSVK